MNTPFEDLEYLADYLPDEGEAMLVSRRDGEGVDTKGRDPVLPTLCFVIVVLAILAALGRSAMPSAERLPLMRWSTRDLLGNVLAGARRLAQLHQRDQMTPPKRTRSHH